MLTKHGEVKVEVEEEKTLKDPQQLITLTSGANSNDLKNNIDFYTEKSKEKLKQSKLPERANKLMSQPNWAKSGEIREFCNKLDKVKEVVETLLQQEIDKNPANKTALENIKQELIKIGGLGTITPTTGGGLTHLEKEKKALKDELKVIVNNYKGQVD
ncbi:4904_t:CDS:2, partial [Racocetra fulgida]